MSYSDLIIQQGEYTYSANIQFDIENDRKLLRFIPNETTISLFKEYFIDIVKEKPSNHARILYGSYGTGKSHFLTVLSLLLGKMFTTGVAFNTFIQRVESFDSGFAEDILAFETNNKKKPFLIVPIVFDFSDFDRCIYFSLQKALDNIGVKVIFKTFYGQAAKLIEQWKNNEESFQRLNMACKKHRTSVDKLERGLSSFNSKIENLFKKIFSDMTYGVNFIYEISSMSDSIRQANEAISNDYTGIVFIFDEFGRYIEDNIKSIKVKSVQDLAECCDHCEGNNHIILVSHKEITQYTKEYGKAVVNEWKKVEGRYTATPINDRQDQCLSLIRNILVKSQEVWPGFQETHRRRLEQMYADAVDFKGFLLNQNDGYNPFEGGFPIHPIALFALDKLSKKVAQNERTFFTYLASTEENSLHRFLQRNELDDFHFVGIDEIYDYFETNIKSVQSDISYEWYKHLQASLAKNGTNTYDDSAETKILKTIAAIGIINDGTLTANKKILMSVIDCGTNELCDALENLIQKKIIKYSGIYDRYEFYDASIFDINALIETQIEKISDDIISQTLNSDFINFVLYPYAYNLDYKISRIFVPLFASYRDIKKKAFINQLPEYYDGTLVMLFCTADDARDEILKTTSDIPRSIIFANYECENLTYAVKRYNAIKFLESIKEQYTDQDPSFERELQYCKEEQINVVLKYISNWRGFKIDTFFVAVNGEIQDNINTFSGLSEIASNIMFGTYDSTLIVNNELINKNVTSGSMNAARKNAIQAITKDEQVEDYYGLTPLSPEYILVRSVLAKNGFYENENVGHLNSLPDGRFPQEAVRQAFNAFIHDAQHTTIAFNYLYQRWKKPPFGLRDGYIPLLLVSFLLPYKKDLLISNHNVEQEFSVELFEDMIKRPDDYTITIASLTPAQQTFLEQLEIKFKKFIDSTVYSKNRMKAIYEGMFVHYKLLSKFARTTGMYVSDATKMYRKLMEKSYTSYSHFLFTDLSELTGDYISAFKLIETILEELETSLEKVKTDLVFLIEDLMAWKNDIPLAQSFIKEYETSWVSKRKKAFDFYTNSFLDFASKVSSDDSEEAIVKQLTKSLTGFEYCYWNDSHKNEFKNKLTEIKLRLDDYNAADILNDKESKLTISSVKESKSIVFDSVDLSPLCITMKNKLSIDMDNFGMSIPYEVKVQVLISMLEDLMEGK